MNEIIVALDRLNIHNAIELAQALSGKVWGFKVNDLLIEHGTSIINQLKRYGGVFADPKLHDIPNTVMNSVDRISLAGADMITVHVSGGRQMLDAAMKSARKSKIIGVTMLTSLNPGYIRDIYRGYPLERLSDLVVDSKIHGVVCAAQELPFWSLIDLIKVVPSVRPFGPLMGDDQFRSCETVETEYIVIGRPITQAKDPLEALQKIKERFAKKLPEVTGL